MSMMDAGQRVFDTLFDTLPSGLLLFSPEGRIIRMNLKAKELFGLPDDFDAPSLGNFPFYLTPLSQALEMARTEVNRSEISLQLPTRDEESTIGYSLKHLTMPNGGEIRALTFSDITQVVKDRLAMDKIRDELNQSKKLASIGTMIAGVAHEMNNPLAGISMSTSLARMNLERLMKGPEVAGQVQVQASLEKTLSEIDKIARSSEKAAMLVSDLLAYSKPSQLALQPIVLSELIGDTIQALRTQPQFLGFTFEVAPLPEPKGAESLRVLCDRLKLEQVFYNLFKNACDATEGKGALTVTYAEDADATGKSFVTVYVRDNGPGIDKTLMARIFDPFFTTKGHSGVGLGLSISYRTVEQHGGLLSVDSEKGQWTEFQVRLPVYLEDDPSAAGDP